MAVLVKTHSTMKHIPKISNSHLMAKQMPNSLLVMPLPILMHRTVVIKTMLRFGTLVLKQTKVNPKSKVPQARDSCVMLAVTRRLT